MNAEPTEVHDLARADFEQRVRTFEHWFEAVEGYVGGLHHGRLDLPCEALEEVERERLIRVLCDDCKKPYKPSKIYLESIGVSPNQFNKDHIYKAVGCDKCIGTGYSGRLGIFEIMRLTEKLKSLILGTYDANQIKNEARREKMLSLRQDGIQKVLNGVTTIEEVLLVTQK